MLRRKDKWVPDPEPGPRQNTHTQQESGREICQVPLTHKAKEKSIMTKTMHHIRDYKTAVKHGRVLKPYSYTERKVRAATRNMAWGPHGSQLVEIAQFSFKHEECGIIFKVLEERFRCPPEKWRNVNKALCVLEFLVQRGSEEALTWASSETMMNTLERLEGFSYVTADKEQRDVGATVRQRARTIRELLLHEEKLHDVRKKGAIQSMRMAGVHIDNNQEEEEEAIAQEEEEGAVSSGGEEEQNVEATNYPRHERTLSRESTKGVSEEDNARHIDALKYLLGRPENAICADCGMKGTGCRPTWASISLGVFMCLRCAGIHRSLGVHISQVRSCSLDVWAYHQVEFMARCGGNDAANGYWEHGLEKKPRILTIGDLENFIRDKYVGRKYCSEEVWPPVDDRYMDEDVWTVLKGAMNEQQLADYECRQGYLDESCDEERSSQQQVSLIDLMDDPGDLIGNSNVGPLHHDPFGSIHFDGMPSLQNEKEAPGDSDVLSELQWDISFADGKKESVEVCGKPQEDSTSAHAAFGNEAFESLQDTSKEGDSVTETLEYLGLSALGVQKGKVEEKCSIENSLASSNASMQQRQKPVPALKPQEKKAHDLLLGALQDFDLAAGIASVSPKALYSGTLSSKDRGCPMIQK